MNDIYSVLMVFVMVFLMAFRSIDANDLIITDVRAWDLPDEDTWSKVDPYVKFNKCSTKQDYCVPTGVQLPEIPGNEDPNWSNMHTVISGWDLNVWDQLELEIWDVDDNPDDHLRTIKYDISNQCGSSHNSWYGHDQLNWIAYKLECYHPLLLQWITPTPEIINTGNIAYDWSVKIYKCSSSNNCEAKETVNIPGQLIYPMDINKEIIGFDFKNWTGLQLKFEFYFRDVGTTENTYYFNIFKPGNSCDRGNTVTTNGLSIRYTFKCN